jgi:hypothetical protein
MAAAACVFAEEAAAISVGALDKPGRARVWCVPSPPDEDPITLRQNLGGTFVKSN